MREPSEKAIEAARAVIDKHDTVCSGDHCRGVVEEAVRAAYAVDFPVRDGELRERVAAALYGQKFRGSGRTAQACKSEVSSLRREFLALADAALGEVGDGEARLRERIEAEIQEFLGEPGHHFQQYNGVEIARRLRKALDAGSSPSPAEKECPERQPGIPEAMAVQRMGRVPSSPADEVTVRLSREEAEALLEGTHPHAVFDVDAWERAGTKLGAALAARNEERQG